MALSPAALGVPARARDHVGAKLGAGGQDPVEPEQVKPGRGDQRAKFLDELHGIQEQMRGAIAARLRFILHSIRV